MNNAKKITIGCDPEFIILLPPYNNIGCILPASEVGGSRDTPFGGDGELFEIRPGYSHNTLNVVSKIRDLLVEGNKYIKIGKEAKWRCGHYCFNEAIGGHIHIGNLPPICDEHDLVDSLKITLIDGVSDLVDPLRQRAERRRIGGYGDPFDYRGDATRIEYRGPGSFLISPKITFLNLIVAKVTAMLALVGYKYKFFMNKKEPKPQVILREVLNQLVIHPIFRKEPDRKLGIEVLKEVLEDTKPIDWKKDFRINWGII